MVLEIDESERQLILVALGRLAVDRPGWDYALNEVAKKMDSVSSDGRAEMYEKSRKLGREEYPPTFWVRLEHEDPV